MKKKTSDPIKTVLTITVGFVFVFLVTKIHWFLYVALFTGLIGMFSTFLAKKIDFLWMKLTWILSFIIPNVLLTLVFFIFLTPIAFLSRIFQKKDQLHLKNTEASIYKDYNKIFTKKTFENPW